MRAERGTRPFCYRYYQGEARLSNAVALGILLILTCYSVSAVFIQYIIYIYTVYMCVFLFFSHL